MFHIPEVHGHQAKETGNRPAKNEKKDQSGEEAEEGQKTWPPGSPQGQQNGKAKGNGKVKAITQNHPKRIYGHGARVLHDICFRLMKAHASQRHGLR